MKKPASVLIALLTMPAVAMAHSIDIQKLYDAETKRRCPSHHVEWLGNGAYDEITSAYEARLSPHLRQKVSRISNGGHRCSDEVAGLSCEWDATIEAYWKINRLTDFAAWMCNHVKRQESALCKFKS